MGRVRWRALLTGALAAAAALRMAWVIGAAGASFDRRFYCGEGTDRNVEAGHSLIHGLPHEHVFWSMPAGSTANALLCRQTRPAAVLAAPAAAFVLSGLMVFGLGRLLAGGTAGALALALFSWITDPEQVFNDRWLFALTLLLVAFLTAWRARFPSARKTALLAAAIGFSLNVLSVLFLLPAVLAAWDWRSGRGRPRPERLRGAALLLIVPCLFLLPWTFANWRTTGRLVFLEDGRSDTNVITGALGRVQTAGPSYARAMVGLDPGRSAVTWAAGEVARHPLRFLDAVARRLLYAASLQPLILSAALLALVLFRRRPAHAQLGVLILYFLGIHCLMAVEERYFRPLWPLAAAVAAGLVGLGRTEPEHRPRPGRWAACALLPVAGLAAYAAGLVLAYPSRSADPAAWQRELSRDRGSAWLWGAEGARLLRAGRPGEAVAALTRSLRIAPQREQEQLRSWALMMRGGSGPRLAVPPADELEPDLRIRQTIMRAMVELRAGRKQAAAGELAKAAALQSSQSRSWGSRAGAATRDTLSARTRELLSYWPVDDRLVILAGLSRLPVLEGFGPLRTASDEAREALRQAAIIRASGAAAPAREEALRMLDYAERLAAADDGIVRRAAEEYAGLGAPGRAVDAVRRLAARRPRDLALRFDLALLAHAAGRREAALRALSEARGLCSGAETLRRLADAYREIGEPRRAAEVLTRLSGGRAGDDDLAELARLRLTLGEHDESLRLLDALVRRSPENARWHNDRAVALAFLGRKEEAIAELRLALAKDPGLRSAAQSLAALLSSPGELVIDPGRTRPPR